MNANKKRFGFLFVATLLLASSLSISHASELSTAGVYMLVEINGEALPAFSWPANVDGQDCREETIQGALLLDSKGGWAVLLTEREICSDESGSDTVGEQGSDILVGSYEISGKQITLHFMETVTTGRFTSAGERLVFQIAGVGKFEGHTAEYVLLLLKNNR